MEANFDVIDKHMPTTPGACSNTVLVHKRQKALLDALAHPVDSMPATYEVHTYFCSHDL